MLAIENPASVDHRRSRSCSSGGSRTGSIAVGPSSIGGIPCENTTAAGIDGPGRRRVKVPGGASSVRSGTQRNSATRT
jgi:hypothetical protein